MSIYETAYIPVYLPGTDIKVCDAEVRVYPVCEGNGRLDDVWVYGDDGKLYTLSDKVGRAVLAQIEKEQPRVWAEIRAAAFENSGGLMKRIAHSMEKVR